MKTRISVIGMLFVALFVMGISSISAQVNATAIVTANHLNVRDYPDPYSGNVIARVGLNEVYTVTGRNSFNHWWQLRLSDGRLGWVNGNYITIYNAHLVPYVNPGQPVVQPPPVTQSYGTVTAYYLNVRQIPNPYSGVIIARITRNETYAVVGRNLDSSWWQLRLSDGRLGWVNGDFLTISNAQLVPQTDNTTPNSGGVTTTGVVTAYFLNVRNLPNAIYGVRIAVIARGESYVVIGRNSNSTWWQIRLPNGTSGWVSNGYFSVTNGHLVGITG